MVLLSQRFTIYTALLLCLFNWCSATEESPGFFLKVTKNVPRLGRRSQSNNEFENFFLKASKTVPRIGRRDDKGDFNRHSSAIAHLFNQMSNQPKRLNSAATKVYNNVQPFDSLSLQKLISEKAINGEDFKFISWNDFDIALESDTMLFERLASLNNLEASANDNSESNFVPVANSNNFQNINDYFYRVNRNGVNTHANGDLNKEKISYQE